MEVLYMARRSSIAVRKPVPPSFDEASSAKLRAIEQEYRQGHRYGHRMGGPTPSPSAQARASGSRQNAHGHGQ